MKLFSAVNDSLQSWYHGSHRAKTPNPAGSRPSVRPSFWEKLYSSKFMRVAHPPLMLTVTVISLTSVVGYRYYNQPQLGVGSRSPLTIVAPAEGEFLDEKTTEEKRKEVRTGIVPRLRRDVALTLALQQTGDELLEQLTQLRRLGAPFPYVNPTLLSLTEQQYLRSCSESDWDELQQRLRSSPLNLDWTPELPSLEKALQRGGKTVGSAELEALVTSIQKARQRYARVINQSSSSSALSRLSPETIIAVAGLTDASWNSSQQRINQAFERILRQGLSAGISTELLHDTIQVHLRDLLPAPATLAAEEILFALLDNKYNLTIDKEETRRQAEQAAQAVQPILVKAQEGEVIVKAGEVIEQPQFVLLDGYGLSQRGINWSGLLQTAGLVTGAVVIFGVICRYSHRSLRRRDHILLFLLGLTGPVSTLFSPHYLDLTAIGLLTSSYYGPTLAISQVVLVGGLSAIAMETINWEYLMAGLAAGLFAGALAGRLRSRDDLALLGFGVGFIQGGVYLIGYLVLSATPATVWYALLPGALGYGVLGTLWTIVAIGISPYLERFFDVITPIRLVELSNPNCPLLQRLAKEAPGTFQHTLFVASLAESAARELHCNVELVRAGTLYHDIGKMHDPLGFIENQMGGPNKHDTIADPFVSAQIIKAHVSEGLAMARRYGLPQVVRDFIPEHQGTMLISYFYHQAKQQSSTPMVEAEFRYDGPIPRSRETGIVMLADSSEAALRSLKETNPEVALAMVNRIFKARWRDNQLQTSGLKYEELPLIANVFVRVWQQFHHQRIVYPQAALDSPPNPSNA